MTRSRMLLIRRISMLAVGLALAGATTRAQQTTPTPTPSPTSSPKAVAQGRTPLPTPTIEQRFEQPNRRLPPTPPVVVEDPEARTYRWSRPIFRVAQSFELKAEETASAVRGILSDLKIDGHVRSDVVCIVGDVTIGPKAVIDGSLVVIAGNAKIEDGAKVDDDFVLIGGALDAPASFTPGHEHVVIGTPAMGRGLRALVPWVTDGLLLGRVIVPSLPWMWSLIGIIFFIGLMLNLMFNKPVAACADVIARRPMGSFLMGLLVLMLLPIFFAILAASVIGLLVVPFAVAALIVAILIGRVAVSRALGRMVMRESDPDNRLEGLRSFTIGAVLVVITYMIPVLGILAWMFVGSFALGSATMAAFGSWRREKATTPPKPTGAGPSGPGERFERFHPGAPGISGEAPPEAPPSVAYAVPPPIAYAAPPVTDFPHSAPASSAGAAALDGSDLTLYPRAGILDRLAAVALDFVLVGIAAAFLGFDRYRGPEPFFTLLFFYHLAFWGWKGTTLGGIICSVRIVRTSRAPMRFIDAVVRGLTAIFSFVSIGIGYLWMLHDPERQTWHDKIAGTIVVKVPRDLVLD